MQHDQSRIRTADLPYQVERVTQCHEGIFARRIIDDLIDSKVKDL